MATQEDDAPQAARTKTPLDALFEADSADTENDPFAQVGAVEADDAEISTGAGADPDAEESVRPVIPVEDIEDSTTVNDRVAAGNAEPEVAVSIEQEPLADVPDVQVERTETSPTPLDMNPPDEFDVLVNDSHEDPTNAQTDPVRLATPSPTSPVHLEDAGEDDLFSSIGNEAEQEAPGVMATESSATEHDDDPFSGIGDQEVQDAPALIGMDESTANPENDPFSQIGNEQEHEAPTESETEDPMAGHEKDWSHLLDDFTPLEDEDTAPDASAAQHAESAYDGGHSGDGPGQDAFDEYTLSSEPDFLQAASSSTTPPPNLSIENSFAHSESRDAALGDLSMQSEASHWLADTTMDDQPFEIQADTGPDTAEQQQQPPQSAVTDDGNSPLAFDVPYGWYDGDTFQYYTEVEREQVRLTMLGQSAGSAQESPVVPQTADTYTPAQQSAFSENAARRTPNPEQHPADPYAPSSSRQPTTSASSYYSSQYTSTTGSTDPYAPTSATQAPSSMASLMQTLNPYAPAPPAWDPYPDPSSSSQNRGGLGKPGLSGAGPRNASSKKPTPPQRVASTAYDPPFLRPQKSFVRPVSAAPISSESFGMTPPPMPLAPAAPVAPPSGPPRRSTTPQVMAPPPQPQHRAQQSSPQVPQNDYAPSTASAAPLQMAPPKPPSRPPSTAATRPPQRAPSYNSFDPPLRAQPTSRPPSRAPQVAGPPQQSPATTLLSPTTDYASAFPERPSSRGSAATRSPAFEPPPPSGPPRRTTPSFQPPPRAPSAASSMAPPPRPPSVSRHDRSPVVDYGEVETLASPPIVSSHDIPQLHSGQEEPDEEGGAMDWDEADDEPAYSTREVSHTYMPPQPSSAASSYNPPSAQYGVPVPPDSNPSGSMPARPPPLQSRGDSYDPYAAPTSRSPAKSPREAYHPYRRASNASPMKNRKESYNPYEAPASSNGPASQAAQSYAPQDAYNPYGPQSSHPSAPEESPSSLGLSSLQPSERYHARDDYAPPVQRSTGYNQEQDDRYAPVPSQASAHDPYGPAAQQYTSGDDSRLRVASPGYSTDYGTSPPGNNYFSGMNAGPADHTYTPQQVLEQKPLSEDPLGRSTLAARNKPLAIFGFGGVLVSSFPGIADVDNETLSHARTPSYGYASGRGQIWIRPVSEIVSESALKSSETAFPGPLLHDPSTTKNANDKKKKDAVLAYLNSRADEIEKGLPYLKTSANATRREQEGKLALIRVLIAMVIGDGKLSGNQQVDEALRLALQNPSNPSSASSTFSPTSVAGSSSTNGFATSIYGASSQSSSAGASPAQLSQLSTMLASGDKRDAALYAASQGLWAHALLASSSVDQEFWREMVSRFTSAELQAGSSGSAVLRTSYAIFAGLGPTAVDDLVAAAHITDDPSADQWRDVISSLLFNGKPTDLAYFDELAQRFSAAGLINAGHICSLLSPLSPFADITPGGLERPIEITQTVRDEDAIIFAEIAEYARSLIPVPKGQELPVSGLPQLLPYKLARAWWAAELGEQDLAKRYCTAIESVSKAGKNGPTLLSRSHLNSLEDLQERLTGQPSTKPANLFGGRKQTGKPGVNKLGSWIEGRLTKFIAGEEDTEGPIKAGPPAKGKGKESSGAAVGPFSHFSTISPGPSNPITRRTSTADMRNGQLGDDADSPSIGHQATTSSSASSLYGDQYGSGAGYGAYQPYAPDEGGQEGDEDTPHALEPTSADDNVELLNPMAALSLGSQSAAQNDYGPPSAHHQNQVDDDDEDLGFGNTSLSRARTPRPADNAGAGDSQSGARQETAARAAPAAAPAAAASSAAPALGEQPRSGWLRGWFGKKEGDGPGPVRAKLGEESSMVYDNDLKRWVVKGAKPEAAAPAAAPPPPRAQTASPSKTARDAQSQRASSATPPPSQLSRSAGPGGAPPAPPSGLCRSSTASLGFTEMADGGIKRQKSSLAESMTPGDAPPAGGAGPPRPPSGPSRPASASIDDLLSRPPSKRPASAARKGAKNRYVDVFQGQGNP